MGAELAEEIGEKPDKVRELLGFCRQPMSLDRKVGEALETDLGELLPDDRLDPDERMAREMLSWQYEKIRQRSSLQFGVQLDHITRDNQNTTLSIPMG
jgi:DNA-directed RNA polymerase sigma subunit (sigma70/sigma32)